jgi:hypothetical protein
VIVAEGRGPVPAFEQSWLVRVETAAHQARDALERHPRRSVKDPPHPAVGAALARMQQLFTQVCGTQGVYAYGDWRVLNCDPAEAAAYWRCTPGTVVEVAGRRGRVVAGDLDGLTDRLGPARQRWVRWDGASPDTDPELVPVLRVALS